MVGFRDKGSGDDSEVGDLSDGGFVGYDGLELIAVKRDEADGEGASAREWVGARIKKETERWKETNS